MVFGDSPCGISRLTLGLVPPTGPLPFPGLRAPHPGPPIGPSPSLGSGPPTLVPPPAASPSLGSGPPTLAHSPVQGEHHLQLAHLLNLHHGCAQLPLASVRQHPLGIGGDSKDVPEA